MNWTPNRRERTKPIKLIVLHSTGGSFASAVNWLMNRISRVSAHYVVGRDGTVRKLAPLSSATYHAGRGEWRGERDVNSISVGVEIEHVDGKQDFPEAQVAAVVKLIREIRAVAGQVPVTSHAFVARPKGRKVDPAGFPFDRIPPPVVR